MREHEEAAHVVSIFPKHKSEEEKERREEEEARTSYSLLKSTNRLVLIIYFL